MIKLFKALVLPNLEYCCQPWAPLKAGAERKLESVLRTFTSEFSGIRELKLDHWRRLKHLGLYSPERREVFHTVHSKMIT
jgi:hypothetical protein